MRLTKSSFLRCSAGALVALLMAGLLPAQDRPGPKLVQYGWDRPSTAAFRQHLATFEATTPFDGAIMHALVTRSNGSLVETNLAFGADVWDYAWFQTAENDLRLAVPSRATHNFLMVSANPGNVDFFDDAGWLQVVDHWRLLARLAKRGNLKGLAFDAEPYTAPFVQFRWRSQPQAANHDFRRYQQKARQRGREVMQAVVAEFPDPVILALRLFSDLKVDPRTTFDVDEAIADSDYGLIPAFVEGWLEAAGRGLRIVDGNEDSYLYNSRQEFLEAGSRVERSFQQLLAPAFRQRAMLQMSVGHAMYLDAYINPPSAQYYVDPMGLSPAQRFQINLAHACETSDEYVWVYGEQFRFWPQQNPGQPGSWESGFPGVTNALLGGKDPTAGAEVRIQQLLASGNPTNLAPNPSFTAVSGGVPTGWWTWQENGSQGTLLHDPGLGGGSARITDVRSGCFGCDIGAAAGQLFVLRCNVQRVNGGDVYAEVGWKSTAGAWLPQRTRLGLRQANGWSTLAGFVQAPPGAGSLVLLLSARSQYGPQVQAWFDDVAVYRLN